MKYRFASWLYGVLTALAERGEYDVDTGAEWHTAWGPFTHHGSEEYQYLSSYLSLGELGSVLHLCVEDVAIVWSLTLSILGHQVLRMDCRQGSGKGREHEYIW